MGKLILMPEPEKRIGLEDAENLDWVKRNRIENGLIIFNEDDNIFQVSVDENDDLIFNRPKGIDAIHQWSSEDMEQYLNMKN